MSIVNHRHHHIIPLDPFESTWLKVATAKENSSMAAPQLIHRLPFNRIIEGSMIVGEEDHIWYSCNRSHERRTDSSSVPTSRLVMLPPTPSSVSVLTSPTTTITTPSSTSSSSSNSWVETTFDLNYQRTNHAVLNIPGYGIIVSGGRKCTHVDNDACGTCMEYYPFDQHTNLTSPFDGRHARTNTINTDNGNHGWLRLAMRLPKEGMIGHPMVVCEDHIIVIGREQKSIGFQQIKGSSCAWSLPITTLMRTLLPKLSKDEEMELNKTSSPTDSPHNTLASFSSCSPRVIEYHRAMSIAKVNVWKELAEFGTNFECNGVIVID
jgi:hypothetical protein